MRPRGWLLSVALVSLVLLGAVSPRPAVATDIEALRAQAQTLGARVSELESELSVLTERAERLRDRMESTSRQLGFLELQKHELQAEQDEALDRYVARAIEAYKDTPGQRMELILGAHNMSELLTLAEAQYRAADRDAAAVDELAAARAAVDGKQRSIDERQIGLAAAAAEIDELATDLEATVTERRSVLREVVDRIDEIEAQARRAAAASSRPDVAFLRLVAPAGPAPGIPDGFAGTGVRFEGVASWYGPGFEGNHTASGDVFDPDLFTAASRDLPLGTWLHVQHGSRGVVVLVNDRGPFIDGRVLDLSQAAAESLGISGLGWIEAELLVKG